MSKKLICVLFGVGCLIAFAVTLTTYPVSVATYPRVFVVSKGEPVRAIAERLVEERIIHSSTLFILLNHLFGGKVISGSYHFLEPKNLIASVQTFAYGEKSAPLVPVQVKPGADVYAIAKVFAKTFPSFSEEGFIDQALPYHGYLYPDTYFFASDEHPTADVVIALMRETFERRMRPILLRYAGPYSEQELVTLASIVELEASKKEDRERIASVLFNRLEADIPLQVDVSFLFINGKNSFTLTRQDLATDDPLNTYRHKGIPPIPISNPSVDSLEALVEAPDTEYLYFLADLSGVTHFSKTYTEHLSKKERFLSREKIQAMQSVE